jgi:lambda family phage portal protein
MGRLARATRNALVAFRRSMGGYDVAGGGIRWPLAASMWSPVNQALAARHPAATKAGYLTENSPTAAAIVNVFVTAVGGGEGVTARSAHPDQDQRAELEQLWNSWADVCDIEGIANLQVFLARVVRSLIVHGEGFTRLIVDQGANLRLALLAPEQIDASVTRPSLGLTGDAPRITAGVETDAVGRRLAYWVRSQPDTPWASVELPIRIDAADILHIFEPRHPGMVRGISWLAPIATRLVELDSLEDAVLAKARTNALFSGFIRDIDGSSGLTGDTGVDPATLSLEPGALRLLPPGADVTFTPTTDQSGIDGVLKHMLRTTAAGVGAPYELVAGDLSEVNFSSARLGLEAFKRRVGHIQQAHIAGQFLQPIWARLMLLAILNGAIRAPGFEERPQDYLRAQFFFAQPEPLDPLKAAKADAILLGSKIKSRAELVSERSGRDVQDVDREIAADPYSGTPLAAGVDALVAQSEPSDAANQ